MCLHPVLIDNPDYNSSVSDSKYRLLHNTQSQKIPVPCGRCAVCLRLKQQYLVQRVQMEALDRDLYFGTLTYSNQALPTIEMDDYTFNYVDILDWQNMLKCIRKYEDLPSFKYFFVTEYGGKRHRPHVHFILSFPSLPKLADKISLESRLHSIFLRYWRRNVNITRKKTKSGKFRKNTRNPKWLSLCTFKQTHRSRNFDLHYLNPYSSSKGVDDVAFYVGKYTLKYDKWLDRLKSFLFFNLKPDLYTKTWDKMRPRRLMSKGFGVSEAARVHIRKGIEVAVSDPAAIYPYFISPVNGQTFPLSPYFKSKYLTVDEQILFRSRMPQDDSGFIFSDEPDLDKINKIETDFFKICEFLNSQHTLEDDSMHYLNNNIDDGNYQEIALMDNDFADGWQDF